MCCIFTLSCQATLQKSSRMSIFMRMKCTIWSVDRVRRCCKIYMSPANSVMWVYSVVKTMRRCRVVFALPPEININRQSFSESKECNLISIQYRSPPTCEWTQILSVVETNELCEHNFVSFCHQDRLHTVCRLAVTHICIINMKFYGLMVKDYILFEENLSFINHENLRKCCACFKNLIYTYILFTSVITTLYKALESCILQCTSILMLQSTSSAKLIRVTYQNESYLQRSKNLRVLYPLSKWITTSPRRYPSKFILWLQYFWYNHFF